MSKFTVCCVQNRAVGDTTQSLDECRALIDQAAAHKPDLICLPEFLSHLYVDASTFDTGASQEADHPAITLLSGLAKQFGAWILLGSIAVIDEQGQRRNRSVLLDDQGLIRSRYDKIHMFDVSLGDGEVYRESDYFTAGETAVIADTPFARIGLSVCYDLRFAALYRLLAHNGAQVLTVPAAFTHTTGKAHWHVLLRSRAIETGSYVVAPCQYGVHGAARTYGHSLIIDPWGEILAEGAEDQADVICAEIDLDQVVSARQRIPALQHDRPLSIG